MAELADELPDNSPRFILLSYPLTLVSSEYLNLLQYGQDMLTSDPGIWKAISPLRDAELSTTNLLKRIAYVIR